MRVNIEQSAWTDMRFILLAKQMKMHIGAAIGMVAYLWMHCQENQKDTFTESEIKTLIGTKNFIQRCVDLKLLEKIQTISEKNENISDDPRPTLRVCGMRDRLDSLESYFNNRRESGRLGGLERSKRQASAKHMLENSFKQNVASGSMSLSGSKSGSMSKSNSGGIPEAAAQAAATPVDNFEGDVKKVVERWALHLKAHLEVESVELISKHYGLAKIVLKRCSGDVEGCLVLIGHFFRQKNSYYQNLGYSLECLLKDHDRLWAESRNFIKKVKEDQDSTTASAQDFGAHWPF